MMVYHSTGGSQQLKNKKRQIHATMRMNLNILFSLKTFLLNERSITQKSDDSNQ